ncbi:MAG: CBU_0592 family membrane protein [Nanobdellota archaeon]
MIEGFDIYSIIGWVGVIFIVIAYIFFSQRKLKIDYVLYHLLNFLGAVGLVVSTFVTESWPALALGLIFAAISIAYITKILKTKPKYRDLRD